ncbi:MAG: M14 family metallopeptidase [Planctomycetota bacterium]
MKRLLLTAATAAAALCPPAMAQEAPTHQRGNLVQWESLPTNPTVPPLKDLLGFEIGEHFVRQHQVVDTVKAIADSSDRVMQWTYGETYQRRPLTIAVISSPENLRNIDDILAANRRLSDPNTSDRDANQIIRNNPAVAWLSFGVHGNEASCPEAALLLIHRLASAQGQDIDDMLDNLVVAIDPSLNPDGRMRYVSWYENQYGIGSMENTDPQANEHWEPWPGGRTNHYYFDLNRDWIWTVHPESKGRIPMYRRFRPQLHIDNHEQGYRSPYFFGLGDEPYNQNISMRTREWLSYYTDVYSEVFDREGKLYATKERFDYLYLGYGKVLPVYQGAVSMLNEQGGHSRGGLGIEVSDTYTLTLAERARNHFLINISALEVTAKNREGTLRRFREYFRDSVSLGESEPFACVISPDNDPQLLKRVWDLCQMQGIEVRRLTRNLNGNALYSYETGERTSGASAPAGSWVIANDQPLGRLVKALFERTPVVTKKDTYDITSWSLPVAFGLDAYYTTDRLRAEPVASWSAPAGRMTGTGGVALLIDADQHNFPRAVNLAAQHGVSARFTGDPIEIDGATFGRGSLIVHNLRNQHLNLREFAQDVTAEGVNVHATSNGITTSGPVLGANANGQMTMPNVGLIGGDPTSSGSFGGHWHVLDLSYPLPYSVLPAGDLGRLDLSEYNALVLPVTGRLSNGAENAINDFVRGGGVLVATGSGAYWAQSEIVGIEASGGGGDDARPPASELTADERYQRGVEDRVPGSLFNIQLDTSHPLAAGMGDWVGFIKRDARYLQARDNDQVIGRYAKDPLVGGLASDRNRERIGGEPAITAHRVGSGWVICFADDATFRGFTHDAIRMLVNAMIYGPSL